MEPDLGSVAGAKCGDGQGRHDRSAELVTLPSLTPSTGTARRCRVECRCAGRQASGVHGVRFDVGPLRVARGLLGEWPTGYHDRTQQNTPAWKGVDHRCRPQATGLPGEFARNATESEDG